ncbi:dipeptide epimerase [Rhodanobacter sp. UC4436_H3]
MPLTLKARADNWALIEPVRIARGTYVAMEAVTVELTDDRGNTGRGEAMGLPYDGETQHSLLAQIAEVATRLSSDTSHEDLLMLLPPGGARNAIDCALWDLRAKQSGRRVWELAGMATVAPVCTAYTLGLATEADFRRRVRAMRHMPLLKIKANREQHLETVRWAREEHPAARLVIDANQSWDRKLLDELVVPLAESGVELIEQPVPRGQDDSLSGYAGPMPLAADESCTDRASLPRLRGLYQFVNIKLDKCGGLTEGLALAEAAATMGFGLMVGNMGGSSLSMAPHFVVAQRCQYVDLDAPLLCSADRPAAMKYMDGYLTAPQPELWG